MLVDVKAMHQDLSLSLFELQAILDFRCVKLKGLKVKILLILDSLFINLYVVKMGEELILLV